MNATKKQMEMLDFIKNFIDEKGYSPSFREIAKGSNLTSLGTVQKYMENLAERNLIKMQVNKKRAVEITGADERLLAARIQKSYKAASLSEKQIIKKAMNILGFSNLTNNLD